VNDPHTLGFDQKCGILTLPTIHQSTYGGSPYTFVEMFDLRSIVSVCAKGSSTLGLLDRITMSGGNPVTIPAFSGMRLFPHDIVPQYISDTKVRLFVGSTCGGDPSVEAGGIGIVDVDYSSQTAATVSTPKYWPYDMDRETPNKQFSNSSNGWWYRQTHTAAPFFHTNTTDVLVVTADEFAGPRYNLTEPTENQVTKGSLDQWIGGIDKILVENPSNNLQDDRRLGAFVRIWNTTQSSGEIDVTGTGTYDGPLSLYDPIESTHPDDLNFASRKQVPSSSINVSCSVDGDKSIAPNTVHRVHTISPYNTSMFDRNANDVIVSAYAAGCRVFNLTNTISNATVLEKAFFDFIPTLKYTKTSDYFYTLSSGVNEGLKPYQVLTNIGMYFWGVWHSVADFGTARVGTDGTGVLPEDEKFIHVMAFGEGRIVNDLTHADPDEYSPDPTEVQTAAARNWLSDGGFMVLRYFDGKLGGTISGYSAGANNWGDRKYQTVNLQGDFNVERDVYVAAGACVNLLAGHASDPGVFTSTSLLPPSSGTNTVYVEGVLNVSVLGGDALGTDIVIDVPIVVRTGGSLIVNEIATGKKVMFKQKVTIESGGTWKFTEGANVELYFEDHDANGKFLVEGTTTKHVKVTSRSSFPVYSKSAYIKGRGTTNVDASLISIEYGDFVNVFIDLDKIAVRATITVLNSDFRTTRDAEKPLMNLFKLTNPLSNWVSYSGFTRPLAVVNIEDSKFSDAQSGVAAQGSIQYGISVSNARRVKLINVELNKLFRGLESIDNGETMVSGSLIKDCTWGINSQSAATTFCANLFDNNEFSSNVYASNLGNYKDNNYSNTKGGLIVESSGIQYFRNNVFSSYCYGAMSYGSTFHMRNQEKAGDDIEYGRNKFQGASNYFGTWGCNTTDIGLARNAQLIIECGYNDFSGSSEYHVTSDGTTPQVLVSYNKWNPGTNYQPRFSNLTWVGDHLDQTQAVDPSCLRVVNNAACGVPIVCSEGGGEDYLEMDFTDTLLYSAVASIQSDVANSSLNWRCRRDKAWEYFEVVSRIDSSTYYTQLKSDMQVVFANTSLDSNLRSAALFIKANVHVTVAEYDSAQIVHTLLRSTFPFVADSVPSNWATLYINSITDTLDKADSLRDVYTNQILSDLRRKTTYGSTGLSKMALPKGSVETPSILQVTISKLPHPNPLSIGNVMLTIKSNNATSCEVNIVNVQGQIIYTAKQNWTVGDNNIEIDTEKYLPGTYFARINCNDTINGVAFTITR